MIASEAFDYYNRSVLSRGQSSSVSDIAPKLEEGVVFAILTDEVVCKWQQEFEQFSSDKLLEIRVFNDNEEFHAVRDSMGAAFVWRHIRDDEADAGFADCTFDDVQYLDIDEKRSNVEACEYHAIGGGSYRLPIANAERIKLRNYLIYDEDGMAQIVDFRIVSIIARGE